MVEQRLKFCVPCDNVFLHWLSNIKETHFLDEAALLLIKRTYFENPANVALKSTNFTKIFISKILIHL